jgi:hypothetical protein
MNEREFRDWAQFRLSARRGEPRLTYETREAFVGAPKSAPAGLWSLVYDEPLRTSERPAVPVCEQLHQTYRQSRWFDRHPFQATKGCQRPPAPSRAWARFRVPIGAFSAFPVARQAARPRRRVSCETAVSMPSPSKSAAHDVPRVACPERVPRGEKLIRTGPLWVRQTKPRFALRLSLAAHPYSADRHHVVGVGTGDERAPSRHDRPTTFKKTRPLISLHHRIADLMRKTGLGQFERDALVGHP